VPLHPSCQAECGPFIADTRRTHCERIKVHSLLVLVLVMHIWDVRVFMGEALVPMGVRMRLTEWIARQVVMLVVLIVHVRVCMLGALVKMIMLVVLREMEPHADTHQ